MQINANKNLKSLKTGDKAKPGVKEIYQNTWFICNIRMQQIILIILKFLCVTSHRFSKRKVTITHSTALFGESLELIRIFVKNHHSAFKLNVYY